MQQMQKVRRNRILKPLHLDAPSVARIVMPIQQHRSQARQQRIRDPSRAALLVALALRQHATQNRHSGPQHVHRMRRGRQQFQRLLHRRRQTAQRPQARLVCRKLRHIRQLAVHQQIRDLFKLAVRRQVLDVVSAIVQIVAAVPHRAQRSRTRRSSRQCNRFLWLERPRHSVYVIAHCDPRRASS